MTTTTPAPATKAPAKAKTEKPAAKAPATKAPAKKAATPATTSTKIRWTLDAEKDDKGRAPQHGTGAGGVEYSISGSGGEWKATATVDGKVELLAENVGHTKAYTVCVKANAVAIAVAA
jgi:hypothetical protein